MNDEIDAHKATRMYLNAINGVRRDLGLEVIEKDIISLNLFLKVDEVPVIEVKAYSCPIDKR